MKSRAGLVLAGLLAASIGTCTTYYALEIRGGSRVYAVDKPLPKGRVLLFHRYPDGVYTSVAASEVTGVVALEEAPPPDRLAPGQAVFVGPTLHGPAYAAPPAVQTAPPTDTLYLDSGYGYYDGYWGGGGWVPPPRPPAPAPPTRIGPNGFPILAPPGTAGSTPPPIGANGFPILAPQPPAPSPRQRPQ